MKEKTMGFVTLRVYQTMIAMFQSMTHQKNANSKLGNPTPTHLTRMEYQLTKY